VEQVEQVPLLEEQVVVEELYVQDHKHRLAQAEQEVREHLIVLQEQLQHTQVVAEVEFMHLVELVVVQVELAEEVQEHLEHQMDLVQLEQLTLVAVVVEQIKMMRVDLEQELQAVQESWSLEDQQVELHLVHHQDVQVQY
tara:strand:- start:938 stop:1357 length:420 start_codon:yes stop_codon:yes gene_type:complete